jgi:hypothetical protein
MSAGSAAASEMPALNYAFILFHGKKNKSYKRRKKHKGLFTSRPLTLLNLRVWRVLAHPW